MHPPCSSKPSSNASCTGSVSTTGEERPRPLLKIALLIADTPPPEVVQAGGGDYGHLFAELFARAARRRGDVEITIHAYDVVNKGEYPNDFAKEFDAILITGSASSAYDEKPWIARLVQYVVDVSENNPRLKIVGICFGHQIVARAFGGSVEKNSLGWEVGWTDMQFTAEGKDVLRTDKSRMRIMSMHQDHVVDLPENFIVLLSTAISPNQAMLRIGSTNSSPVLTIQGHPEYTPEIVESFLKLRLERRIFTKEFVDAAMAVLRNEHDSVWFTDIIVDFLLGRL